MSTNYQIETGQWAGWQLRIGPSGAPEARGGARGWRWAPAPLRLLAKHYAVGEGPWPWLREHGIRRPSPSGPSGEAKQRHTVAVQLRLQPELAERLKAHAEAKGTTVSGLISAWIEKST